jgi:hypothetical protein
MVEGWVPTIRRQIANMNKPASRSCEGGRREVATLKRGACARALSRDSYLIVLHLRSPGVPGSS